MPKIVVLDGYTVNPGDLSWGELKSLADCEVFDRTTTNQTLERCAEAEIILTNKVVIDKKIMKASPKLRYIGVLATGYNVVDVVAARDCGIIVCNVPAYSTPSVAQMTFALLMELTNHVALHSDSVTSGEWSNCPDFSYRKKPLLELDGLTLGIVGFGAIGQSVAKIAESFGMKVVVHTAHPAKHAEHTQSIDFVSLNAIFADTDVITIHCPQSGDNEKFVNAERLGLMKETGYLINTARGALIDEDALAHALNNDQIAGAALDVLSSEPPSPDNPLLKAKNCLITPHIAWAAKAARQRLLDTATANVAAYLNETPKNIVNSEP